MDKPKSKFKVGDRVITNGEPSDWGKYLKVHNNVYRAYQEIGRIGTVTSVHKERFYYYYVIFDEAFYHEKRYRQGYCYAARQLNFYRRKNLKEIIDYWEGHPVTLKIVQLDEKNFGWEANGSLVLHGFSSDTRASEALSDRIYPPTSEIY